MFLKGFFAPSGSLAPYKMFTQEHFVLVIICLLLIASALYLSRNMTHKKIYKTAKICTLLLWIFETIKIIFNLTTGNAYNPNTYIPLYFCSIVLYAGILTIFAKGRLKRAGKVFIVVGGIIGGIVYLFSPSTTAGSFPVIHYITIQSFLHHSIMVYLGMLFVIRDYIVLKKDDWVYYTSTVVVISAIAYIVNIFLDSNLMFVSKNFPGTLIEVVYNKNPTMFPVIITLIQAVPPFIVIYELVKLFKHRESSTKKVIQCM